MTVDSNGIRSAPIHTARERPTITSTSGLSFPSKMSHKAAVLTKVGAPLEDVMVPTPKLGEDEVLVEVQYICLSPLDIWRSKQGLLTETPKILGGAFSGRVAALGPKVVDRHDLAVGVAVSCFSGHLGIGAHQQYVVVPWWCLSKVCLRILSMEMVE